MKAELINAPKCNPLKYDEQSYDVKLIKFPSVSNAL